VETSESTTNTKDRGINKVLERKTMLTFAGLLLRSNVISIRIGLTSDMWLA